MTYPFGLYVENHIEALKAKAWKKIKVRHRATRVVQYLVDLWGLCKNSFIYIMNAYKGFKREVH